MAAAITDARLRVVGVHNYGLADLVAGVDWLARRGDHAPAVVGRTFPLDDIEGALAAASRREALRIGVRP